MSSCSSISGVIAPSELTQTLRKAAPHQPLLEIQTIGYRYDDFYCGPAGLATLLQKKGRTIDLTELSLRLVTPGKKGTFRADLTAEARKRGLIPIAKSHQPELLVRALENGEPVLTLVNLSFNWAPQWHYFAVYGYNKSTQSFLVHDGNGATVAIDSETFDRLWARANYWMLTIHEPTVSPANWITAKEWLDETLTAGSNQQEIQMSAAKIGLEHWPQEAAFAFILGDIAYNKDDSATAARYFEQAIAIDPTLLAGHYNLAYILFENGDYAAAEKTARKGLLLDGKLPVKASLQDLLEQIRKKSANQRHNP